jgi:hypothetical protein
MYLLQSIVYLMKGKKVNTKIVKNILDHSL